MFRRWLWIWGDPDRFSGELFYLALKQRPDSTAAIVRNQNTGANIARAVIEDAALLTKFTGSGNIMRAKALAVGLSRQLLFSLSTMMWSAKGAAVMKTISAGAEIEEVVADGADILTNKVADANIVQSVNVKTE